MGLIRTVEYIVEDRRRSVAWKVVDVAVLLSLWTLLVASVIGFPFEGNGQWKLVSGVAFLVAVFATARTWYDHPEPSKSAVARQAPEQERADRLRREDPTDRSTEEDPAGGITGRPPAGRWDYPPEPGRP